MECDRKVPGISGSGKKIKTFLKKLLFFLKNVLIFLEVPDFTLVCITP